MEPIVEDTVIIPEEKYPAGVTAQMVADWKKTSKNGIAELESGDYKAYIRRPTRDDMRELGARDNGMDKTTYTEVVLDLLWLGGDEEIRSKDAVFFGVSEVVLDVLDVEKATLKKL